MNIADLDVLIVDDHEVMRTLLQRALSKAGVTRLRSAVGGDEAIAALRERPAALILTDSYMPGMSGFDLIKAVRSESAFGTPKIIIVSGNGSTAHAVDAINAGADHVMIKPVSLNDLFATINKLFAV